MGPGIPPQWRGQPTPQPNALPGQPTRPFSSQPAPSAKAKPSPAPPNEQRWRGAAEGGHGKPHGRRLARLCQQQQQQQHLAAHALLLNAQEQQPSAVRRVHQALIGSFFSPRDTGRVPPSIFRFFLSFVHNFLFASNVSTT